MCEAVSVDEAIQYLQGLGGFPAVCEECSKVGTSACVLAQIADGSVPKQQLTLVTMVEPLNGDVSLDVVVEAIRAENGDSVGNRSAFAYLYSNEHVQRVWP
jgi:hypothetical protein